MILRRLTPGDEELAAGVVNAVKSEEDWDGEVTAGLMKDFLANESNYLVVAYEDDATALGFALGYRLPRVDRHMAMMYLHEVGVIERWRNQGVGTAIMTR